MKTGRLSKYNTVTKFSMAVLAKMKLLLGNGSFRMLRKRTTARVKLGRLHILTQLVNV